MEELGTVSVIGLGYIGLPTAALLARVGYRVVGVDVDERAVETVNGGGVHIVEVDLEALVRGVVQSGMLRATTRPEPTEVYLIAVPTPLDRDRRPDMRYVEAATRAIAPVLERGATIILESTSPVGTTERMARMLAEERPDLRIPQDAEDEADVHVAHCPERVLPGRILQELRTNDRVVGGITRACAERARSFYRTFVEGECLVTNARTAELVKLTENSFRDVNIAFANELSVICHGLGIDVWELLALANRHPRVSILRPGPGVGGHCIAVDPWFIVDSAPEDARMIRLARQVNDEKPGHVVRRVQAVAERFKAPVIACLGLAFKADVDDLRESPALDIVLELARAQAGRIIACEPYVSALPAALTELGVERMEGRRAIREADIVLLLVDHRHFRAIPREHLLEKIVVDTRGLWAEPPR